MGLIEVFVIGTKWFPLILITGASVLFAGAYSGNFGIAALSVVGALTGVVGVVGVAG